MKTGRYCRAFASIHPMTRTTQENADNLLIHKSITSDSRDEYKVGTSRCPSHDGLDEIGQSNSKRRKVFHLELQLSRVTDARLS